MSLNSCLGLYIFRCEVVQFAFPLYSEGELLVSAFLDLNTLNSGEMWCWILQKYRLDPAWPPIPRCCPRVSLLPYPCLNCGNSNLTKFALLFFHEEAPPSQIPILFAPFLESLPFNLHLERETIPPNQGFTNFTRPHPWQEILLSSSFSHLHTFTTEIFFTLVATRFRQTARLCLNVKLRKNVCWDELHNDCIDLSWCCYSNKGNGKMWNQASTDVVQERTETLQHIDFFFKI